MPEMVGFYNQSASLPDPTAAYQLASDPQNLAIKKLVCSPDLPLPAFSAQSQVPLNGGGGGGNMFTNGIKAAAAAVAVPTLQCPPSDHHQSLPVKTENGHYACNVCPKTFTVPARLQRHMRTHTGEKPYECEICHKRFSVKENLSVHRRIHTKERPYKCTVCCRAFEHSGKLHRHMRIHTGERPHKCDVCEKTFIQSGQLVIHKRTHTGEKPYVCTNCHKGFTCSKQLKVHSRTHTGEKPYSCDICGKSFGYNHVLKLHQVAHYGEKVYKCTICNDTFNNKKNMELHIKSHSENNVAVAVAVVEPPTPPSSNPSSEMGASDKENSKSSMEEVLGHGPNIRGAPETEDLYYLYSRSGGGLSPSYLQTASSAGVELLAAAASVRESGNFYSTTSNQGILLTLMKSPQPVGHPAYFSTSTSSSGDDIRKRVEAALALDQISTYSEERAVTPPSSNPVSPTPSSSTPPASPDPELSLPPRKRSRMIQKSMEDSIDLSPVRYTVIQYAGAS